MRPVSTIASLAALVCAATLLPIVHAQSNARTPAPAAPAAQAQSMAPASSPANGPPAAEPAAAAPVLVVTSVELIRGARPPEIDIIRVRGLSGADGWTSPQLIPITRAPAADGMLELLFIAQAPGDAQPPTGFGAMEAVLVIEPGHPYKGVRVRAASNSLSVTRWPGFAEAAAPASDCSRCVGKIFVAKGSAPPAGAVAADIVQEKDLPPNLRVLRPTDGIGRLDADPNRLTLVLGDDGRVSMAMWD